MFLLGKLIQCGGNPGGRTDHITTRNARTPFDLVLNQRWRLQGEIGLICQKSILTRIKRFFVFLLEKIIQYGGDLGG